MNSKVNYMLCEEVLSFVCSNSPSNQQWGKERQRRERNSSFKDLQNWLNNLALIEVFKDGAEFH